MRKLSLFLFLALYQASIYSWLIHPYMKRVNYDRKCSLRLSDSQQQGNWDPYSAPKLDFDECYYEVKFYLLSFVLYFLLSNRLFLVNVT